MSKRTPLLQASPNARVWRGCCVALVILCASAQSVSDESDTATQSTPRVEPLALDAMTPAQKDLLGIVEGNELPKRATTNLFRTLIHHADLMSVYLPLGDRVSKPAELDARDRELMIMRIAWIYQGEYEWAQHYEPARNAGLSAKEIERIKNGPDAPGWQPFERTLLRAADQLVLKATLDDKTWNALLEKYSIPDLMVMTTMVAHYHWVAMMTKAMGIQLENGKNGFEGQQR